MVNGLEYCPCNLNGLGAETALPAHYLVPMTKIDIGSYIYQEKNKGVNSTFASGCNKEWVGFWGPCLDAMLEIERANLYYVNGFMTWDELQGVYKFAQGLIASIPVFPTIKEQLKNAGTFLIGAVGGFLTAGPIGLFTGGAAATKKIIADARAKAAGNATELIRPMVQKVQASEQERQVLESSMEFRALLPVLIGTAFAGAALVFFGDDLKKLVKKA